MSQRDKVTAELETVRLFILRYRDIGGPVTCDGWAATESQIVDLKVAIARFQVLSRKLGGLGAFDT